MWVGVYFRNFCDLGLGNEECVNVRVVLIIGKKCLLGEYRIEVYVDDL